jgi:hypothetical protein
MRSSYRSRTGESSRKAILSWNRKHTTISTPGSTLPKSRYYVIASKCCRNHFTSEKFKIAYHLSYTSFKIIPLCNYRPAIGKLLEIFIFCDSFFSSTVAFLLKSVASGKLRLFNADFSPETGKNQLQLGQGCMGNNSGLSRCSLLINPRPKPTGVLEHCHQGETNDSSPFFGTFPPDRIPKGWRMSMCISLLTITIPVNNTIEFRERFAATTYLWLLTGLYWQCQISCWRHFQNFLAQQRPRHEPGVTKSKFLSASRGDICITSSEWVYWLHYP